MSSMSSENEPLLFDRNTTAFGGQSETLADSITSQEQDSETKSNFYIFMLVLGIGGLQLTWAIELSNGSPYLQSLGISKSLLSLVWIAGPLSGALVQPYVGMRSDTCQSPWGRRKPFIWGGAVITIVSLMLLAWAHEIVVRFGRALGLSEDSNSVVKSTAVFATIMVYVLDFAVNTIQAGLRALIIDCAPVHQQEQANAAAGIMTGLGNVLAYLAAELNLPTVLWFLGRNQFQILSTIACLSLAATVVLSSAYVREDSPQADDIKEESDGLASFLHRTYLSIQRMPLQLQKVCLVQFFHWIGWFPFLFYITTYIGQLHVNPIFEKYPKLSQEEIERHWEEGTRIGSFALLIFSITSFVASIIVPLLVNPTYKEPVKSRKETGFDAPNSTAEDVPPQISPSSHSIHHNDAKFAFNILPRFLRIRWLTLRRAWLLSQIIYFIAISATFFITTTQAGIVVVGVIGVSWALTQWVPFALIAAEISKKRVPRQPDQADYGQPLTETGVTSNDNIKNNAGMILGIHNVAITCPQIIAALAGSAIFSFTQKPRGEPGDESTGWVLRFGGLATLAAIFITFKIQDQTGERDGEQNHV